LTCDSNLLVSRFSSSCTSGTRGVRVGVLVASLKAELRVDSVFATKSFSDSDTLMFPCGGCSAVSICESAFTSDTFKSKSSSHPSLSGGSSCNNSSSPITSSCNNLGCTAASGLGVTSSEIESSNSSSSLSDQPSSSKSNASSSSDHPSSSF